MPRIFISYSHDDYADVGELAKQLSPLKTGRAVEIWHDDGLRANQSVPDEIQRALLGAELVVVLLSKGYLHSEWCRWELAAAHANAIAIVPVLLRDCAYQLVLPNPDVLVLPRIDNRTVPLMEQPHRDSHWTRITWAVAEVLKIARPGAPPPIPVPRPVARTPQTALTGQKVGPWTLGAKLGSGGYGVVFEATDADGRVAAVKIYRPRDDADEDVRGRARFRKGPVALRKLASGGGHPGIVRLIEGPVESDNQLWYAMERVPGKSLKAAYGEFRRLPLSVKLACFRQVVHAVRFAHAECPGAPVWHRDITPENLLVDFQASPPMLVLVDFDLARDLDADSMTRTQGLVGKDCYVPPEQLGGWDGGPHYQWDRPVEELRDLWSLGMLLHFMSCGSVSHHPEFRKTARVAKLEGEEPDLCAALDTALDRLLHLRPSERPHDIAQVEAMVAALLAVPPVEDSGHVSTASQRSSDATAMPSPPTPDSALRAVRALLSENPGRAMPNLVELATNQRDAETLQLAGAALLALGAPEAELDKLRALSGGGIALGIPEPAWAHIPAGEFMMGREPRSNWPEQSDEIPPHRVKITQVSEMLATPVTQALYAVVTEESPSRFGGDLRRPVEQVSWEDAQRFCEQLGRLLGRQVRLPTEAEWEYACRAGTETPFWSGEDDAYLRPVGCGRAYPERTTHPVAEWGKPNAWGLHDMHGNVWEWTADWYAGDYYATSPAADPAGPSGGGGRVMRGGSWYLTAGFARAAYRRFRHPAYRDGVVGFRVVLPARSV
jgi:formylglycine-generating enzyme required for sulfatase activity/serine/threonine protein kinase